MRVTSEQSDEAPSMINQHVRVQPGRPISASARGELPTQGLGVTHPTSGCRRGCIGVSIPDCSRSEIETDRPTDRQTQTKAQTQTHTHTQAQAQTQTHTKSQTQTQTQTQT